MTNPDTRPTAEEISEEVIRLASEYPGTVYTPATPVNEGLLQANCSYLHGKAGPGEGCIFGQALRNLGVSEDHIRRYEGRNVRTLTAPWLGVPPSSWTKVQSRQDKGLSWGEAVVPLLEERAAASEGNSEAELESALESAE